MSLKSHRLIVLAADSATVGTKRTVSLEARAHHRGRRMPERIVAAPHAEQFGSHSEPHRTHGVILESQLVTIADSATAGRQAEDVSETLHPAPTASYLLLVDVSRSRSQPGKRPLRSHSG